MRIVFAGTPEFAVSSLRAAARHHEVVAVYTQPDRPAGRGRGLAPSPVKLEAVARGIPVYQPESLKDEAAQQQLRDLQPDLMVVVAYGLILPKAVLAIPTHGCWNVHASLLPRWRGAAPIHRAIEAGDAETGVTLMQMDIGLDTGAMIEEARIAIAPDETTATLHDRLAADGARLIVDALVRLERDGTLPATPQPADGVTYAEKIGKHEAALDWRKPADVLARQVRAFDPFPGGVATLDGAAIKLWAAEPVAARGDALPGTIVEAAPEGVVVACGSGALRITQLQKPGGKRLPAREFLAGSPLAAGQRFAPTDVA